MLKLEDFLLVSFLTGKKKWVWLKDGREKYQLPLQTWIFIPKLNAQIINLGVNCLPASHDLRFPPVLPPKKWVSLG